LGFSVGTSNQLRDELDVGRAGFVKPDEVKTKVAEALRAFMDSDSHLLTHDLSERCIASRVAYHLQHCFPDHSVDVEYNRAGHTAKRLNLPPECAKFVDENGESLVFPDIIIHHRGADGPNLLGIEIKKEGDRRGVECDRLRLKALKLQMKYTAGALLVFETRAGRESRISIEWL
jgi:hypothetical protein